MFCNNLNAFPAVSTVGDVIRIHRAKKDTNNSRSVLTAWGDTSGGGVMIFKRRCLEGIGLPVHLFPRNIGILLKLRYVSH